jgi:hypothetical protein
VNETHGALDAHSPPQPALLDSQGDTQEPARPRMPRRPFARLEGNLLSLVRIPADDERFQVLCEDGATLSLVHPTPVEAWFSAGS